MRRRTVLAGLPALATAGGAAGAALGAAGCAPAAGSAATVALPPQLRGAEPPVAAELVALDTVHGRPPGRAELAALAAAVGAAEPDGGGIALGAAAFGPAAAGGDGRGSGTGGSGGTGAGGGTEVRPRRLRDMPAFPGDLLDPARTHGQVLVQLGGRDPAQARERAARVLAALPGWRPRWRAAGHRPDSRVVDGRGLARNPFHFTEGFGNPDGERATAERTLVRPGDGEPEWAAGGSYQVVRLVQIAAELWDRDSLAAQERVIGRRRDGRWLDGTPATERPDFAADPAGRRTPLDSHVRRAAPDRRRPPPLVRRSYSHPEGLLFSCFQRDPVTGFEAVQHRLAGEAMATYLLTVGGGYFFVPPPGDTWLRAFA
ncbi:Dyp-type peroxidase [Streptomyces sp. NPDC093225]|uniref:Dyp-type peroxidase n=1 Tax=Streptomyces sp. NPDC093225 TaxID=3366034 RepID=UPI0037FC6ED6